MRKIFLYGPPGSGKTIVGKKLSKNLKANFIDVDSRIEFEEGMSISQIITEYGETRFRDLETAAIEAICNSTEVSVSNKSWMIVALGGGALLREQNRICCEKSGEIIFLDVDLITLVSRLKEHEGKRPLLAGDLENKLVKLLDMRKEHYLRFKMRVANIDNHNSNRKKSRKIHTKTPDQIAWEIQQKLGCYHVSGMGIGYDIVVESGGLARIGQMLKERGLRGPIALVCDENVDPLYSKQVLSSLFEEGFSSSKLVIKSGEENKTLETVANLWRGFLNAGLDRKSLVIALGGGVVGDLAGFAASTYLRGCPWVAVPTSLLSMVDASLGGKTGFDLPEGKNLVGSFYPPRLVLADPDVLLSLPEAELRSGMAEVVKHGIISDPDLFEFCALGFEIVKGDLERLVRQAIGVKVKTIVKDPYEAGIRAALNLGHTVGHGVELASHFKLRHGEAVAIGLVAEARLAEKLGITENKNGLVDELITVLLKLGLPTEIPANLTPSAIIQAMRVDKKKDGNLIKFALPVKIGLVKVGVPVSNLDEVL